MSHLIRIYAVVNSVVFVSGILSGNIFMPQPLKMPGAYSVLVLHMCVRYYVYSSVHMYVTLLDSS